MTDLEMVRAYREDIEKATRLEKTGIVTAAHEFEQLIDLAEVGALFEELKVRFEPVHYALVMNCSTDGWYLVTMIDRASNSRKAHGYGPTIIIALRKLLEKP